MLPLCLIFPPILGFQWIFKLIKFLEDLELDDLYNLKLLIDQLGSDRIFLSACPSAARYFSSGGYRAGNSLATASNGTSEPLENSSSVCYTHHPPRSTRGTRIVRPPRGGFGVKAISSPLPPDLSFLSSLLFSSSLFALLVRPSGGKRNSRANF